LRFNKNCESLESVNRNMKDASFIYFGGLDRRSIQIIMTDFPL